MAESYIKSASQLKEELENSVAGDAKMELDVVEIYPRGFFSIHNRRLFCLKEAFGNEQRWMFRIHPLHVDTPYLGGFSFLNTLWSHLDTTSCGEFIRIRWPRQQRRLLLHHEKELDVWKMTK